MKSELEQIKNKQTKIERDQAGSWWDKNNMDLPGGGKRKQKHTNKQTPY